MENENQNSSSMDRHEQGLPSIAKHDDGLKKFIIIGAMLFVMILVIFIVHKQKPASVQKPVDDTYSVQSGSSPQIQTTLVNNAPNQNHFVPVAANDAAQLQIEQEKIMLAEQMLQQKQKQLQARLKAPMLLNNSQGNYQKNNKNVSVNTGDANTTFMNEVTSQEAGTVSATNIGSLDDIVTEGTFIHAVLETAINSDLPGNLRAIISEPVYSANGANILIPRGSRLIGEYKSNLLMGQSRIFVVWTRLITPDGISVDIASPGVDSIGQAGIGADVINRHFCEIFGTSTLLSILAAGASNVGVSSDDQYNASQSYRIAIADSLSDSASSSLQQNGMISPTLTVYQGTLINVFVAHNLDFSSALQQDTNSNMNVF